MYYNKKGFPRHLAFWIATLFELDNRRQFPSYFAYSGGSFLLAGKHCPYQALHNELPIGGEGAPGFLLITSRRINIYLDNSMFLYFRPLPVGMEEDCYVWIFIAINFFVITCT